MWRSLTLLLLLAASLTGCSSCWTGEGIGTWFNERFGRFFGRGPIVQQIDSAEVSRVVLIYSEKLKYEKELTLDDSTIYYDRMINRIRLDFSSMASLDVWEARELLVDVVEGFLERLNENMLLIPYFSRVPMTPSNLEVYIKFVSYYNKDIDLQTVGLISLRGGITNLIATDAFNCDTECWHRRTEYYFQTRNFVRFKREGDALYKPEEKTIFGHEMNKEKYYSADLGPAPSTPTVRTNYIKPQGFLQPPGRTRDMRGRGERSPQPSYPPLQQGYPQNHPH